MKTKNLILLTTFVFSSFLSVAQDCSVDLSLFNESAKIKNYDAAFEPWTRVRNNCPSLNLAIYIYGERILEDKIAKTSGEQKTAFINDLIKLYDERLQYFPGKEGKVLVDKALAMMEYNIGTKKEIYDILDTAFKSDRENFTNPRGLYAYFSLLVDLYNSGDAEIQSVFDKYDDVKAKIVEESNKLSSVLNELRPKEEAGTLSPKEERSLQVADVNLGSFGTVSDSIDAKLGILADCDNLIPLYNKDFENKKTDAKWLNAAASRMSEKECTEDPLYFKLVEAYHAIDPSAQSSYFLGILAEQKKDMNKALEYFNQSADLNEDNFKKAEIYYKLATVLRKRGSFGNARSYANKALTFNPSMGKAYLLIAQMYGNSANDCGETVFDKRAVYWLAADVARKAGQVDATVRSVAKSFVDNFEAKAPSKADVFQSGRAGETIKIGCWIGLSVKVPNL